MAINKKKRLYWIFTGNRVSIFSTATVQWHHYENDLTSIEWLHTLLQTSLMVYKYLSSFHNPLCFGIISTVDHGVLVIKKCNITFCSSLSFLSACSLACSCSHRGDLWGPGGLGGCYRPLQPVGLRWGGSAFPSGESLLLMAQGVL